MTKHTPGPWYAYKEKRVWYILDNASPEMALTVASLRECETPEADDEGNAQLIAAAPELLAALKRLAAAGIVIPVDQANPEAEGLCREFLSAYDDAAKAIAKAEKG